MYRCVYNRECGVQLIELLYVGKVVDKSIREHIIDGNAHPNFVNELTKDSAETICYSYVEVEKANVDTIENALIYLQEPKLNEQKLRDHYVQQSAQFNITGKCGLLYETSFEFTNEDEW